MPGMTQSYTRNDSFTCVTWLINMCDMTHSYVWHDFIRMIWLVHLCDMNYSCVAWLIPMCDMTHAYVRHDSQLSVSVVSSMKALIHIWDMTRSYVWHGSFMCHVTHSYAWHDSFICVAWLMCLDRWIVDEITNSCLIHGSTSRVSWPLYMWEIPPSCVWHDTSMCVTRLFIRVTCRTPTCGKTHLTESLTCVTRHNSSTRA